MFLTDHECVTLRTLLDDNLDATGRKEDADNDARNIFCNSSCAPVPNRSPAQQENRTSPIHLGTQSCAASSDDDPARRARRLCFLQ
eukprot:CAMPEP_0114273082 /NCGR_PEP_ID=MMETSP0058-20121206/28893_1 /TAXON_ID=36894 /ORGANISM="Pyramimonas parkeae, CCMP726" /LENGTH=85 /DNA_ID=CAMNT_0001392485 /DNA_START=920 /DNA_END=1174 /DNA_ORIENTATION=-